MANFGAPLLYSPVTTTLKSAGAMWVNVTAGLARRIQLYEIEMGQTGTLASTDCQCQWDVSRFSATASLAGTAVVPGLLDEADTSPLVQYLNVVSTEPTFTGANFGLSLKQWAINQRGSYRWRALDDGDNLILPATAMKGFGIRCASSGFTASALGGINFIER